MRFTKFINVTKLAQSLGLHRSGVTDRLDSLGIEYLERGVDEDDLPKYLVSEINYREAIVKKQQDIIDKIKKFELPL